MVFGFQTKGAQICLGRRRDYMDLTGILEVTDEVTLSVLFGLMTGLMFGVAAQRSAFCLRAATIEFARGELGPRFAVWLLAFSTALVWVQLAVTTGLFAPEASRFMSVTGSWSGAVIGGLMLGTGMVLARGCSGRLLVLASTGNLRSLVSGLIFVVVAQMSLGGFLSPLRNYFASLWTTEAGQNLDVIRALGLPPATALVIGIALAAFALYLSAKEKLGISRLFFASGVGFSVAVGWVLTYALSQSAFDPVTVNSITFSGPSASALMLLLTNNIGLDFDIGLIPGVVLGAFLAALVSHQLKFEGFTHQSQMLRSMFGAALMGFGAMLAGGCAIGAGLTGGSVLAATAWLALLCMWIGAVATDYLIDQRPGSTKLDPGLTQASLTNL